MTPCCAAASERRGAPPSSWGTRTSTAPACLRRPSGRPWERGIALVTENAEQKRHAIDTHSQQADEFVQGYRKLEGDPYETCFAYSRRRLEVWLGRALPAAGTGVRLLDVGC